MSQKKSRQLRKQHGVKHVRNIRTAATQSQKLKNLKLKVKSDKQNKAEGEKLAEERGKGLSPPFEMPMDGKGVRRLK